MTTLRRTLAAFVFGCLLMSALPVWAVCNATTSITYPVDPSNSGPDADVSESQAVAQVFSFPIETHFCEVSLFGFDFQNTTPAPGMFHLAIWNANDDYDPVSVYSDLGTLAPTDVIDTGILNSLSRNVYEFRFDISVTLPAGLYSLVVYETTPTVPWFIWQSSNPDTPQHRVSTTIPPVDFPLHGVGAVAMELRGYRVGPKVFIVNSTLDQPDANPGDGVCEITSGGGDCTVRAAIMEANVFVGGTDQIQFDNALAGQTITLASALPPFLDAVHFVNVGNLITIQASAVPNDSSINRRVLEISATGVVSMEGLILRHGRISDGTVARGGGILNNGTLSMTRCRVVSNYAYGSSSGAAAHGGGIYSSNLLTLDEVEISSNRAEGASSSLGAGAALGGGVYLTGSILHNFQRCLFTANAAVGGISIAGNGEARGGGIMMDLIASPFLGIYNSTISGNSVTGSPSVGGGIQYTTAPGVFLRLESSTLCFNSSVSPNNSFHGGISNPFSDGNGPRVRNSILYANINFNLVPGTLTTSDIGGSIQSSGFIVIGSAENGIVRGDSTTGADFQPNSSLGNQIGANPLIDELEDNGGFTRTHALKWGSPAVDVGFCTRIDTLDIGPDQRGVARPFGFNCDIGAYEYNYVGRPFGDFDENQCTELDDFLFLVDNWQEVSPIGGPAITLEDFLNLLDYWNTGDNCG